MEIFKTTSEAFNKIKLDFNYIDVIFVTEELNKNSIIKINNEIFIIDVNDILKD